MKQENKNEPPYDTNGNGSPLTGIIPDAIEQLTNIWERKIVAIPTRARPENLSVALNAKFNILRIKYKKKTNIINITPLY